MVVVWFLLVLFGSMSYGLVFIEETQLQWQDTRVSGAAEQSMRESENYDCE